MNSVNTGGESQVLIEELTAQVESLQAQVEELESGVQHRLVTDEPFESDKGYLYTSTPNTLYDLFSPLILKVDVSDEFIEIINSSSDLILNDSKRSVELDWSHMLVGNVHKEVTMIIEDSKKQDYIITKIKQACIQYISELVSKGRMPIDGMPGLSNFKVLETWVVSQYAGDFNPLHSHSGDLSGIVYLKLPPDYDKEIEAEMKGELLGTSGMIEFQFGEPQIFKIDNFRFKPIVGNMYIFPAYLRHMVYPFRSAGERRSMSFNIQLVDEQ